MSYMNPLLAYGLAALAERAARVGVCGFIVPDLPFDESEDLRAALAPHGLALVQMVTPVTPPERLARVAGASQGFVYAVTMTGTTGHSVAAPKDIADYLERVRAAASVPVCAGFGIRIARAGRGAARHGRRRHRRLGAGGSAGARRIAAAVAGGAAAGTPLSA